MKNGPALVAKLRAMGKKVFFITNNSTLTTEEFWKKFISLGFDIPIVSHINIQYIYSFPCNKLVINSFKVVFILGKGNWYCISCCALPGANKLQKEGLRGGIFSYCKGTGGCWH